MAVALFGFRRRPEEERSADFLPEGWPSEQDREHLVVAERVGLTGEMHRVMVDPHKGRIYFENEHTPRLFLARAQKHFECSIGDVLCAKEVKGKGSFLLILTSTGKVTFSSLNGYDNVRGALRRLGVPPIGGPELDSGRTIILGQFYGLFGGAVAASTTSIGMSDFDFYGRILGGAVLGVGLLLLVIWAGQKLLGLRLTLAMTGLLLGGVGIGFLGYVLDRTFIGNFLRFMLGIDAPWLVWVGAAILGAVGGIRIGMLIQRGRELASDQIQQEARTNS
jgi:hypothetical protein